ncbi:MoaD/ThiS family protein [Streptomyces poriticola]|uniref:MoaD/ThiS family protein n=1 Tax=Streptomyces poriticola TaxID=3120506 RepID=UPI002FCE27CD
MRFHLSGQMLRFVDYDREVEIRAATLEEALRELAERHPRLKAVLFDNTGKVRRAHRIRLNGEVLTEPAGNLPLADDDCIGFLTAIAGG